MNMPVNPNIPHEFKWMEPGISVIYQSKTHPMFRSEMVITDYPKLRLDILNPNTLTNWVVSVDWFGLDNPEYCVNFSPKNKFLSDMNPGDHGFVEIKMSEKGNIMFWDSNVERWSVTLNGSTPILSL
jgi:hypothetical protein